MSMILSFSSLHRRHHTLSRLVALGAPIPTTQTKNFQAKNIDAPHPPVAKVKGLMMLGLNRFFPWLKVDQRGTEKSRITIKMVDFKRLQVAEMSQQNMNFMTRNGRSSVAAILS